MKTHAAYEYFDYFPHLFYHLGAGGLWGDIEPQLNREEV